MIGVKCPKCGLTQLAKEKCESCGRKLDIPQNPLYRRTPTLSAGFPLQGGGDALLGISLGGKEGSTHKLRLSFQGSGGELLGMFLLNWLLTVVTLGIYSFWGKVKVRSYLWSKTEFEEEPFVYQGTGWELFMGFLKAGLLFGAPIVLLNILPHLIGISSLANFIPWLTYAILLFVVPVAMVGARRYRLSRTSWRGILFSFRGQIWDFVKLFLRGSFLTMVTLGCYYPTFETRKHDFMISHSYFGNQKFDFDGKGHDLFKPFLISMLLIVPTLGLYWLWFLAKKERYFWEHTSFEGVRFGSKVTGGGLLGLYAGNLLLLAVTLGLAWPWVLVRRIKFNLSNLIIEGLLDPAVIKQEAQGGSATGEVLAGFMDAGFDLGS